MAEAGVPAKKVKYMCTFKSCWTKEFEGISNSHLNNSHAFCKACRDNFNIGHGGRNDVCQHLKSQKHVRAAEAQKGTQAISGFINEGQIEQDQVLQAELKMAMLVAKNNLSFSFCDEYSATVATMFPDSAIAKKYSSGRTKTTQLLKGKLSFFSHNFHKTVVYSFIGSVAYRSYDGP